MQTIGKYAAAFILALASSYFGHSEAEHTKENKAEIRVHVMQKSTCIADAVPILKADQIS